MVWHGIPIVIRTPVMADVNDSPEEILAIKNEIKNMKNLEKYELLPYHCLGLSKYAALGREIYEFKTPNNEKMEELKKYADL